jgi:hypothetical protein
MLVRPSRLRDQPAEIRFQLKLANSSKQFDNFDGKRIGDNIVDSQYNREILAR